jgi:hypothetical protein
MSHFFSLQAQLTALAGISSRGASVGTIKLGTWHERRAVANLAREFSRSIHSTTMEKLRMIFWKRVSMQGMHWFSRTWC